MQNTYLCEYYCVLSLHLILRVKESFTGSSLSSIIAVHQRQFGQYMGRTDLYVLINRGVRLAKNDFGSVFGLVLQKLRFSVRFRFY